MTLSTPPSGELVRSSHAVLFASNKKKTKTKSKKQKTKKNMGHITLKIMRQIIMCHKTTCT